MRPARAHRVRANRVKAACNLRKLRAWRFRHFPFSWMAYRGACYAATTRKLEGECPMNLRPWLQGSLVLVLAPVAGCYVRPAPVYVGPPPAVYVAPAPQPQPTYVEQQPAPPPPQPAYVEQAPPPPPPQQVVAMDATIYPTSPIPDAIPEYQPPAPGYGYYWVGGYWDWTGYDWDWQSGYWAPQRAGYAYVGPRFVWEGDRMVYYRGYWQGPGGYREFGYLGGRGPAAWRARPQYEPRVWRGAPEHATAWRRAPGAPAGGFRGEAPAFRREERREERREAAERGGRPGGPAGGGMHPAGGPENHGGPGMHPAGGPPENHPGMGPG